MIINTNNTAHDHKDLKVFDASSQNLAVETQTLCIGWVDNSRLIRECMINAIITAQPLLAITPFESVYDCINNPIDDIKLIVYYSHEPNSIELEAITILREAFSSTQIIVLSDAVILAPPTVRDVLARGVSGFIQTHGTSLQMVLSAISLVNSGGTFVPRDFLFMGAKPEQPKAMEAGRLTQRELAVLNLMRHGKPNKIIADELGMSASTVKVHVRHIMHKMGAANRTQVALTAERILSPDPNRPRDTTI